MNRESTARLSSWETQVPPSPTSPVPPSHNMPQVSEKPACYADIPRTSSTQRTRPLRAALFLLRRRCMSTASKCACSCGTLLARRGFGAWCVVSLLVHGYQFSSSSKAPMYYRGMLVLNGAIHSKAYSMSRRERGLALVRHYQCINF